MTNSKLSDLEGMIYAKEAAADSRMTIFSGVKVKTIDKSNAWLENKCPDENHKFGLMVDFHIVTENFNQQCKGNDLLNKMEKIFKIEIPTIGRASSIASFKKPLHKYFVTSSYIDFTPIGDSVLYFNMIKTWVEGTRNLSQVLYAIYSSRIEPRFQCLHDYGAFLDKIYSLGRSTFKIRRLHTWGMHEIKI